MPDKQTFGQIWRFTFIMNFKSDHIFYGVNMIHLHETPYHVCQFILHIYMQ